MINIIIIMNRLRGQKKDATRVLRVMRAEQPSQEQEFDWINKSKDHRKNLQLAQLYTSNSRKPEPNRFPRKNYRYGRNSTEHENSLHGISKKHNSVQLQTAKGFRVNQKSQFRESCIWKNPYAVRNSTNSGSINKNGSKRRVLTQQTLRSESGDKNVYLFVGKGKNAAENLKRLAEKGDSLLFQDARNLFQKGKFMESQQIVQTILKLRPENHEALYLSGANNISLLNYMKSLIALNKVAELDPIFNQTMYIMSSMCYYHLGKSEEALKRINAGLTYFPDSSQILFQKGSLLMKMETCQQALVFLKKCCKLAKDVYDPLMKLAECYENLKSYKLAIKIYDELASLQNISAKGYRCYFKKARCLRKLKQYGQYVETLETYLKLCSVGEEPNLAEIYYGISYGYYKLKQFPSAIMAIEEVFKEKDRKYSTQALILLAVIYMRQRDFYEASHTLSRKEHLGVDDRQLQFYELFCEGVICLMKRKFNVGLQKLQRLQFPAEDSPNGELQRDMGTMYPMYLSYAYFCQGNITRCLEEVETILSSTKPQLDQFRSGVTFNKMLCEGLESFKKGSLKKAIQKFTESIKIYSNKPQGYLYLGLCEAQQYLKSNKSEFMEQCNLNLRKCIANLKELNNSYASSAFFSKALVSAYLRNWDDAMYEVDEAIERSQENQGKMFYLRALILGCCQNYSQAIHEVSVAISISSDEPNYYLLRSKCNQIEGDGNKAFSDLQAYINLNPDDTEIHKYAGHLLFQNGAFEDALQAYDNGTISLTEENVDVFLTRAKTNFLVGNLNECISDMEIAFAFRKQDQSMKFDIQVLELLKIFFNEYKINGPQFSIAKQKISSLQCQGETKKYGRIFRKIELKVLQAVFTFYQKDYRGAGRLFGQCVKLKQEGFAQTTEEQFEEEEKEKYFFISQMHYNRAICHLILHQKNAAAACLKKCRIDPSSKTQEKLEEVLSAIESEHQKQGQKQKVNFDLFSQKNKLSRHFNEFQIQLSGSIFMLRLCIPYPKVEPPEINPHFDESLLINLNPKLIERKPEAPWILREENSIKFTQKIQKFSRLDINASELSKKPQSKKHLGEGFDNSFMGSQYSQSFSDIKMKLMLDGQIEDKLNRLIQKHGDQRKPL